MVGSVVPPDRAEGTGHSIKYKYFILYRGGGKRNHGSLIIGVCWLPLNGSRTLMVLPCVPPAPWLPFPLFYIGLGNLHRPNKGWNQLLQGQNSHKTSPAFTLKMHPDWSCDPAHSHASHRKHPKRCLAGDDPWFGVHSFLASWKEGLYSVGSRQRPIIFLLPYWGPLGPKFKDNTLPQYFQSSKLCLSHKSCYMAWNQLYTSQ